MYTEMLSICIALSYNFTVKSWAIFNKSQNESQNVEKKTASEQASRHDTKWLDKICGQSNCNDYFETIKVKNSYRNQ